MTRRLSPAVSRRRFLQGSGAGAAALALAACATPAPAAAPGDDAAMAPVEIDFAAWAGNTDIPAWEELERVFSEQNPDIVVTTAPSGTGADYYTGLQTSIAGGAPPDVASFQGWEWQPYADAGQLAPLDTYIQESGLSGPYPDGVQSIEDSTRRDGKRYLMPLQVGVMLMLYARQPFDDAGLDYPTDDWTFDEFLSMAEQVTNLDGDNRMYGFQPSGIWPRDIHWIRSTGKQEFDQLVDPTTASFDQPEIIEIVQLLTQDLQYKMGISPTPADMSGGTNTIETGNAAMKYEGAWFLPNLNSPELRDAGAEVPFDVVMMPQYLDEDRPHRGWSEGVAVLNTDSVDAAWEYTAFMGGEEGQKIYSTLTGRLPNTEDLIHSFWIPTIEERFGVSNGAAFVEAFKRSEVDVIGGVSRGQMWNEVVRPVGWDPLLNNSATAAEVLPEVTKGVQALLDDYWSG